MRKKIYSESDVDNLLFSDDSEQKQSSPQQQLELLPL